MEHKEEAEIQYKLALEADPNNALAHNRYGNFLSEMGRKKEAEIQYKLALETDPNYLYAHICYGRFLSEIGRKEEFEKQFEIVIKMKPKNPDFRLFYSLNLFSLNLERESLKEIKIASGLYSENGDVVMEHLSLAWLYEHFVNKYYSLKDYQKSGEYAELSGYEYIEAGKHATKIKNTFLTKGYTLLGRAKIRKLQINPSFCERTVKRIIRNRVSYEVETLCKIMDCIADASKCYKKAAEASPEKGQICSACSTSMSCLSSMLDYMLLVIKKEKEVTKLENEIENWEKKLIVCREIYKGNPKGEAFIQSLDKLMICIKNLEEYKKSRMRKDERAFEECVRELREVAGNIEGPLQKIIEDSAKKMDACRFKHIPYADIKNDFYLENLSRRSKPISKILYWIYEHPLKAFIDLFMAALASVIAGIILKTYFP